MDRTDRLSVTRQAERTPAALQARTRAAEALADMRAGSAAQRSLIQGVQASPAMVAQRRALQSAFGPAAQFKDGPTAQLEGLEEDLQVRAAPGVAQRKEQAAASDIGGLPGDLRAGIESLSGYAMDRVNVHYNSSRPAQLNALAYAQGTDIHVAPGQEQHVPHEAWHLVQQAQGRVRADTRMADGTPVNTDSSLEAEADAMGAKALQAGAAQMRER